VVSRPPRQNTTAEETRSPGSASILPDILEGVLPNGVALELDSIRAGTPYTNANPLLLRLSASEHEDHVMASLLRSQKHGQPP